MQPAFFALILAAIPLSVPVHCAPGLSEPEQLPQQRRFSRVHPGRPAGPGRFSLELKRPMRKTINRDFLVLLPVRTETGNFVSIFDLRRKRFLCKDLKGELYNSKENNREDCHFQSIWLDLKNYLDVFYWPLEEKVRTHQDSSITSSVVLERLLRPLTKRQRRSEQVNPSDPLRSESHPVNPAKDHQEQDHGQSEQDQAGAVSKETITSCDDPLSVLHSSGPVSPVKTNIADRAEQD
ncbi:uncharacterized protein ACJ7VT_008633 [Polymixia lowei]